MKEKVKYSSNVIHWNTVFHDDGFDFGNVIAEAIGEGYDIIKIVFMKKNLEKEK